MKPTIKPEYKYIAKVKRIIDGDTYELILDLGFGVHHVVHIRLQGVNTYEVYGEEKEEGLKVKDYVTELFGKTKTIVVHTQYKRSFARWIADVYLDGMNLAEHLLEEGMAI